MEGKTEEKQEKKKLLTVENKTNLWNTTKGIVAMLLTVVCITTSGTTVQLLQRTVPDFELNAFRSAAGLCLYALVFLFKLEWPGIPRSEIVAVSVSTMLGSVTPLLFYISVTFLPLTSSVTLEVTSGMVTGIPLFAIFLEEKITVKRLLFASLCVFGVILVTQPGFIFNKKESKLGGEEIFRSAENFTNVSNSMQHVNENNSTNGVSNKVDNNSNTIFVYLGYCLAIMSGLAVLANLILIKKYTYLHKNINHVLFWQFGTGTLLSLIIVAIFEKPIALTKLIPIGLVLCHSLGYTIHWPLYLYSCRHISANTVNILWSTPVVFSLVMQYTALSHVNPGHRNWMEVVGVVLVLLGSSLGSLWELLKSKE